jgi:hypothetical protein
LNHENHGSKNPPRIPVKQTLPLIVGENAEMLIRCRTIFARLAVVIRHNITGFGVELHVTSIGKGEGSGSLREMGAVQEETEMATAA